MIIKISEDLFQITLTPPIPGFNHFIGSWVYTGNPSFIVDVGPAVTAEDLITALGTLAIDHLDYIFLTHIHIDHAGGIGELTRFFPKTPIVCHNSGVPHLSDPVNLYRMTLKTLGNTAEAYGPILPVPAGRLINAQGFADDRVEAVITPGHASHHVSYLINGYLFAGEAGGVFMRLPSGTEYLRPSTPPPFFMSHTIGSIDTLIKKNPETICYGHSGMHTNGIGMLKKYQQQLFFWKALIASEIQANEGENLLSRCLDRLLREDSNLAGFSQMGKDVQARELYFLRNSLNGFNGYFQNRR